MKNTFGKSHVSSPKMSLKKTIFSGLASQGGLDSFSIDISQFASHAPGNFTDFLILPQNFEILH